MQRPASRIEISVTDQKLTVFEDGRAAAEFPVSTSKFGLGTEDGSNRTPLGRFQILEKIGGDQPLGTIFKSRCVAGRWDGSTKLDDDLILTRILWLDGLEPENSNTHDRYIYIHGTNQEHLLGSPASYGCIRMRNADIAALYDRIEAKSPVWIEA